MKLLYTYTYNDQHTTHTTLDKNICLYKGDFSKCTIETKETDDHHYGNHNIVVTYYDGDTVVKQVEFTLDIGNSYTRLMFDKYDAIISYIFADVKQLIYEAKTIGFEMINKIIDLMDQD